MKESKSAVTIRRRRHRVANLASLLGLRHKTTGVEEDVGDSSEADETPTSTMFETSFLAGPKMIRTIMSSQRTLFLSLLSFRFLNALIIQTSYVPDEYWQSVEVAHRMAFGYGYLTWEWRSGLRGYTYPSLFAFVFKVLGMLHIDSRMLITKVPRLIQCMFAAIGDLYVYRLSLHLSGPRVARWSLLCQMSSWFNFYCSTRTLTNSMEAVLTSVALFYFPWPGRPARRASWHYVTVVAIAVVIRPTAAIIWFPLCLWHVYMSRNALPRLIKQCLLRGLPVLLASFVIDWMFYGKFVNVYYNFLEFNFLSDLGSFYGSHPWHWYFSQGLFVLLATHIFPLIVASYKGSEPVFLGVIGWTIAIYSTMSHKEFRFLMGIMPLVMHVSGTCLHQLFDATVSHEKSNEQNDSSVPKTKKTLKMSSWKTLVIVCLISVNLPLALYTCLIHQRGTVDVMIYLTLESQKPTKEMMNVLFLMPCHSTPYYSHIHRNITMRLLTCEPNQSGLANYTDEADAFYRNPSLWLSEQYFNNNLTYNQLPTHLVMFDELHIRTSVLLRSQGSGYEMCGRFFHTHFPEGRVGTHVIVLCSMRWIHSIRHHSSAGHSRSS